MRLTWRDGVATLFVAAAAVVYGLWLTGTAMTGTSTRVLAAVVFGLGWLACTSNQSQMAVVYGVGDHRPAPMPYIVTGSILGGVAFVAGVIAIVTASEAMLAILIAATIALWAISTVRHAIAEQMPKHDDAIRHPVGKAA